LNSLHHQAEQPKRLFFESKHGLFLEARNNYRTID